MKTTKRKSLALILLEYILIILRNIKQDIKVILYLYNILGITSSMSKLIEILIIFLLFQVAVCFQCVLTQVWEFQYPLIVLIMYYCWNIFKNIRMRK